MKTKRIFSSLLAMLLCLTLIVGMIPAMASAEVEAGYCSAHDTTHEGYTKLSEADTTALEGNYYVDEPEVVLNGTIRIDKNVHICLNGNTIKLTGTTNYSFEVRSTLTICDCQGDGKIDSTGAGKRSMINVYATCTLNLHGGLLTGRNSSAKAGGVSVAGTFNMYGGKISGNTIADGNGGGVSVENGKFYMSGGEISNNTAYQGGAIYATGGAIDISGGRIVGNTSTRTDRPFAIYTSSAPQVAFTGNPVLQESGIRDEGTITVKELTPGASIYTKAAAAETDETVSVSQPDLYHYTFQSAIVSRMILGNNLDIQFAIPADKAENAEVTINGEVVTAVGTVNDGSAYDGYKIYESYIKSNEMTKDVTIQVTKDGQVVEEKTDSVQAYAERLLDSDAYAAVHELLVDMLNYGAEAQKYFDKATDGLANANLSAVQQGAFETVTADDVDGNARLLLENNLDIQIDVGSQYAGKTLKYTFVPFDGNEALTYTAEVEVDGGVYFITADQVVFADYASEITVMDGETEVATDSVLNYVGRNIDDPSVGNLVKALLKFAQSAREYLA